MRKSVTYFLMAVLFLTSLSGCSAPTVTSENDGLKIVATIFPLYDFARALAGDNANISMLVTPGASIHSYDPSPADIREISSADIFIYIGGESDVWVDRILSSMNVSNMSILKMMDYVDAAEEEIIEGMESEDDNDESDGAPNYDEHIWLSPQNGVKLINGIADAICALDSDNAELYRKNAETYVEEIKELDNDFRKIVNASKRNKIVVADRFPFRYLVDEYGLDYVAAFAGCSDQSEASIATIAGLIKTVETENIPYIYYVEMSAQNVAKSIRERTGAELLQLHSCQNVTKSEFESGETYASLMQKNTESLKKGLN